MSILIANPDGSSNAKAGDTVVTGGGIYKKNEDGTSTKIAWLPTGSGTTKDYGVVQQVYNSMKASAGSGTSTATEKYAANIAAAAAYENTANDGNTAVFGDTDSDGVPNYESSYYPSGSSGSTILGYIIVFAVGILVLDKLAR